MSNEDKDLHEEEFTPQTTKDVKENSVQSAKLQTKKKRHPGPWVSLTPKEVIDHQNAGRLQGYDPKTMEGIVRPEAKKNETPDEVQKRDDQKNLAQDQELGLKPKTPEAPKKAKGEK